MHEVADYSRGGVDSVCDGGVVQLGRAKEKLESNKLSIFIDDRLPSKVAHDAGTLTYTPAVIVGLEQSTASAKRLTPLVRCCTQSTRCDIGCDTKEKAAL